MIIFSCCRIIQGAQQRHTIYSKYPVFNLQINHGLAGLMNSSYNYDRITANVTRRFYLSQLAVMIASSLSDKCRASLTA
jgi:hypothetical protein